VVEIGRVIGKSGRRGHGARLRGVEHLDPAAYGDAIADVYDDWYEEVSDVEGTVATIRELAGGGPVLELGIGTGRIALPLAAAGVEVHGVDASAAMVERLHAKPGGDAVPVLVADFSEQLPAVEGGFAVVVATFNTFLNLTVPGAQQRCFELVSGALRPDGMLVLETLVPADDPPRSGIDVRDIQAGRVVLSAFLRDGDVVTGSLIALGDDRIRLLPWAVRLVTPDQLVDHAAAAGFELVDRHAGWRGEPYHETAERCVTVLRWTGGTVRSQGDEMRVR
jgi:SAM-dependent methyltransferase